MNVLIARLKGKKVGLVVNQTSLLNNRHLVDTLLAANIHVIKVFAPEHGFRGQADAGQAIETTVDSLTSLPIVSLYGKHHKPNPNDLEGVETLVFDLQDVGVRFYTYISTLHYVMEACSELNIPLIVLDRPNPNGFYIDGPVLDTHYRSFVGMHPIPIVYGMTIGELSKMIQGEQWIRASNQLSLEVIPCLNYQRKFSCRLPVPPSPNLPNQRAILLYPSICLFEGTVVSLGRGTDFPFQIYGHPAFKSNFSFTPRSKPGAKYPPQEGKKCFGKDLSQMKITELLNNRKLNLTYLVDAYNQLNKRDSFFLASNFIDKLYGSSQLRHDLARNKPVQEIEASWKTELEQFKKKRKKYLLYPDF